ncbi:hypothetical protein MMC28_009772 [Mycoblastus sanguinarius]|nr:hypothetical protein [Mycoblastus sanguinarius]
MGKAGRFACIFTPMALTIASLVCLIIVGLGGTNKSDDTLNNLYFFRANTSDISADPSIVNLPSNALTNSFLHNGGNAVKSALNVSDFYHVSLWNYCSGDFAKNGTGGVSDHVTFCSPHQNEFWFNPVEVWGLNNTSVDQFFSTELRDGLNTYKTVAKWMFIAYIVALISTIVEILIGFLALFSRLGSLATTIISSVSSFFYIAFALTSTILYATLTGTFNDALKKYNIHGNLGHSVYVTIWLGVAFSLASGLFWLFSSCCCSGRSDRIKGYADGPTRRGMRASQGPYNYERVESPMRGGLGYGAPQKGYMSGPGYQAPDQHHGMPLGQVRGTAYEPFRHEDV